MGLFGNNEKPFDVKAIMAMLQPVISIALMKLKQEHLDEALGKMLLANAGNVHPDGIIYSVTTQITPERNDIIVVVCKSNELGALQKEVEISLAKHCDKEKIKKLPEMLKNLFNSDNGHDSN